MKSFAVIGLGLFGSKLATSLFNAGMQVIAMDVNKELVDQIEKKVTSPVVADAKSKAALTRYGVDKCDCAIVCIGDNLADSVLITMNLVSLGIPEVICKAHDKMHCEILQKLNATRVIIPEEEEAERIARSLTTPNFLEYMELSEEYGIIECRVPASFVGKTIRQLNVRAKYGINIIAVKQGNTVNPTFSADLSITEDMTFVILGDNDALERIKRLK